MQYNRQASLLQIGCNFTNRTLKLAGTWLKISRTLNLTAMNPGRTVEFQANFQTIQLHSLCCWNSLFSLKLSFNLTNFKHFLLLLCFIHWFMNLTYSLFRTKIQIRGQPKIPFDPLYFNNQQSNKVFIVNSGFYLISMQIKASFI